MSATGPNYHDRRLRVGEEAIKRGLDAVLITNLTNVRYLSGFTGSNAALLIESDGRAQLATDGRYVEQASAEAPDLTVTVARSCAAALLEGASGGGLRAGYESHHVTVDDHAQWSERPGLVLEALGPMVEGLRVVKDDYELSRLREACAVGDRALEQLLETIAIGQTERQVARRLESLMLDFGGDAIAFETIVASGPNSSIPHHQPTSRPIDRGDFLKLDFGAQVDGYHADMTRTLVVGAEPTGWQRELYELVAAAQAAGRQALGAGVDVLAVDRASRSVIEAAGVGELFSHGLGHGVGLQIHEAPFIGATGTGTLEPGTPVTVEPGVYHPGRGGVRIEDTLVVTHADTETLTKTTKELLVVG